MDDAERQRNGNLRDHLVPAVMATVVVVALATVWFLFAPSSDPGPGTPLVKVVPEEGALRPPKS